MGFMGVPSLGWGWVERLDMEILPLSVARIGNTPKRRERSYRRLPRDRSKKSDSCGLYSLSATWSACWGKCTSSSALGGRHKVVQPRELPEFHPRPTEVSGFEL